MSDFQEELPKIVKKNIKKTKQDIKETDKDIREYRRDLKKKDTPFFAGVGIASEKRITYNKWRKSIVKRQRLKKRLTLLKQEDKFLKRKRIRTLRSKATSKAKVPTVAVFVDPKTGRAKRLIPKTLY